MSLWWFDQLADLVPNHVRVDRRARAGRGPRRGLRGARDVPGRVRRPRLPHRLRPARLPGHRRGVRRARCRPGLVDGSRLPSRSSPPPPRPTSATTTRTSPTRPWSATSAPTRPRSCATLTLAVYARAEQVARERGIILADTKLEFGTRPAPRERHAIVLADEVLTPDSSRFWPADDVGARPRPGVLRQADRAQLAALRRRAAGTAPRAQPPPAAPARGRRPDPRPLRRGVRAADRRTLLMLRTTLEYAVPAPVAFGYLADPAQPAGVAVLVAERGAPRPRAVRLADGGTALARPHGGGDVAGDGDHRAGARHAVGRDRSLEGDRGRPGAAASSRAAPGAGSRSPSRCAVPGCCDRWAGVPPRAGLVAVRSDLRRAGRILERRTR